MEKNKKFTIYLGLNNKETKQQEFTTSEAVDICFKIAKRFFDGITVATANGFYKHIDEKIIFENSLIIDIFEDNLPKIRKFIDFLAVVFCQESIIVEEKTTQSEFIYFEK